MRLEEALLDYVVRYGLTDKAIAAFAEPCDGPPIGEGDQANAPRGPSDRFGA
jgi:hypothetical protein